MQHLASGLVPRLLPGGERYGAPRLAQCAKAPVCGPCPASDQRPHVRVITKLEICSPAGHRDWPRVQWQSQCDSGSSTCMHPDPRPLQLGDVRSFERCPQHPLLKALRIRVDRALALRVRALELASIAVSSSPASVPHAGTVRYQQAHAVPHSDSVPAHVPRVHRIDAAPSLGRATARGEFPLH